MAKGIFRAIAAIIVAGTVSMASAAPQPPQVQNHALAGLLLEGAALGAKADALAPGDIPAATALIQELKTLGAQLFAIEDVSPADRAAVDGYLADIARQIIATATGANPAPRAEPQTPYGMSEAQARATLDGFRRTYMGNGLMALPDPNHVLRDGVLTEDEAIALIGDREETELSLAADLPIMERLAPHFRSDNTLYAAMRGGMIRDYNERVRSMARRLEGVVQRGVDETARRAALDPLRHEDRIRGGAAQGFEKDAQTLKMLNAAATLEVAFDLGPRFSSLRDGFVENAARYEALVARVGPAAAPTLPDDIGDGALTTVANTVLARPQYGIGPIRRLVVNAPVRPGERTDVRVFDGKLEVVERRWEAFQVTTVEDVAGVPTLHFNTIAQFSKGDATTPIGQWILHKRLVGRAIPEGAF
ncbi:MAG: hypothetical protein AAF318_09995 [Pseudomonadota bacterium]